MKRLIVLTSLVLSLLIPSSGWAEDPICFDIQTSGKIVVEIERCRLTHKALDYSSLAIKELENQIGIYEEMLELERNKTQACEKTLVTYDESFVAQKEMYEQALKDAKPSILRRIVEGAGFVGLGALLILIL